MILSKPELDSSRGRIAEKSSSTARRSRMAFRLFRPGEPPEGVGAAGVGPGRGGAVERGLQRRNHRIIGCLIRTPRPHGRHLAAAKFPHRLLPDRSILTDRAGACQVEREPGGFQSLVMAGGAVLLDEALVRGGGRRGLPAPAMRTETHRQQPSPPAKNGPAASDLRFPLSPLRQSQHSRAAAESQRPLAPVSTQSRTFA